MSLFLLKELWAAVFRSAWPVVLVSSWFNWIPVENTVLLHVPRAGKQGCIESGMPVWDEEKRRVANAKPLGNSNPWTRCTLAKKKMCSSPQAGRPSRKGEWCHQKKTNAHQAFLPFASSLQGKCLMRDGIRRLYPLAFTKDHGAQVGPQGTSFLMHDVHLVP